MEHIWQSIARLKRLPVLLALALALPFLTPSLPPSAGLERTIHDIYRYALAERSGYDPDIALVVYDDAVARITQRTSPVDRELLGQAITTIASAKPRAIGLDMAFVLRNDQSPALIEALRSVDVPIFTVYADPEGDKAAYWDPSIDVFARQEQDEFWAELNGSNVERVSPAIGVGPARIARHWPTTEPGTAPLMAHALAETPLPYRDYDGGIRYRLLDPVLLAEAGTDIDAITGLFPAYPLDLLADDLFAADFLPQLEGRIVLIGSDTFGADQLATPMSRIDASRIAGVAVHAHMLRQALDREFPPQLGVIWIAALAIATILAGGATALIERKPALLIGVGLIQLVGFAYLPVVLDAAGWDILRLPLFGLGLSWIAAYFAVALAQRDRSSEERAFARGALGRYVPERVAAQILDDPSRLQLKGEERELTLMFTDLEGFTKFCHGRDPRETAEILNAYLDAMSEVVLAHGGTLDKYVGDALVAFWGAPIDRSDDTERAVACAIAMQAEADRVGDEALKAYGVSLGRTRIGINRGPVIVGNFGGTNRMQYTAMGDAMNIAARLESANKQIGSSILVSNSVRRAAPGFAYRSLGAIEMSGVATGLPLYEPLAEEQRELAEQWNTAISQIEGSNPDQAAEICADLRRLYPDDRAAGLLGERVEAIRVGGIHVLRSK